MADLHKPVIGADKQDLLENRDNPKDTRVMAANPAILQKFGGKFVVRGGRFTAVEGQNRSRNVVVEFPDYETALACYRSPEYQANIKVRQPHAIADLIIIEGYEAPQS